MPSKPDLSKVSTTELRAKLKRLCAVIDNSNVRANAIERELANRQFGIRVGDPITIEGEDYVRVATPHDDAWPSFQKVGGKRKRTAYRWEAFKAGRRADPW